MVQVQQLDDGVTTQEGGSAGVSREYRARAVVSTFSQGVLKECIHSQLVKFIPELPPWKVQSILNIEMALYCKVFLRFTAAFWDNVEIIYYAAKERGHWPAWQNLHAGETKHAASHNTCSAGPRASAVAVCLAQQITQSCNFTPDSSNIIQSKSQT